LLSHPDLARVIGLAGRRRAEQFDWAIVARRTAELYESIVSQRSSAPLPQGAVKRLLAPAGEDVGRRAAALLHPEVASPDSAAPPQPVVERGHRYGR
jgi:hypothetical protein